MEPERPLILIADDEKDIRFVLADALTLAGYRVVEAADGAEAREAVARDHPDLIMLDVRLPKADGMTLLSEFRAAGLSMGVVIMTAHGNERFAVRTMKEGADDYLPKPFDVDDLVGVVERVLHHRETERRSGELAREKQEFVGMMAHDLKGPLTSIYATLEMLLDGSLGTVPANQQEFLLIAHTNAARIRRMIDTFLETYRLEEGKAPFSIQQLDAAAVLTQAHRRFLPVASEKSFDFTLAVEPGLPPIQADVDHLGRILDNLLSNAFKFSADGASLLLGAARDPARPEALLRVRVVDSGPGIAAEDLPHLFEKFSQGRRRREGAGIGLGLAYCRMAVERLGGTIGVDSRPGHGSSFWFTLPFASQADPEEGGAVSPI